MSARRIWNQHSYHVTNVTEGGSIPTYEPDSWLNYGSNLYNTYRSQPRSYGAAPDLTVAGVQLSTAANGCNTGSANTLTISVQLTNEGDVRVGTGVSVVFEGTFGDDEPELLLDGDGEVLTYELTSNIEPKGSLFFETTYTAGDNPGTSGLPDQVRVIVDPATDDVATGAALECDETNNSLEAELSTEVDERAELSVSVGSPNGCPSPTVTVVVTNSGTVAAEDVVVQLYVGDPQAGGTLVAEDTISEIAADDSEEITMTAAEFPLGVPARLYAVVDPENTVRECSDANNQGASDELTCPREIY